MLSVIRFKRFLLAEILERWTMLTQPETESCLEDREKLVRLLQSHYGFSAKRAAQELELFLTEFSDRMQRAA